MAAASKLPSKLKLWAKSIHPHEFCLPYFEPQKRMETKKSRTRQRWWERGRGHWQRESHELQAVGKRAGEFTGRIVVERHFVLGALGRCTALTASYWEEPDNLRIWTHCNLEGKKQLRFRLSWRWRWRLHSWFLWNAVGRLEERHWQHGWIAAFEPNRYLSVFELLLTYDRLNICARRVMLY